MLLLDTQQISHAKALVMSRWLTRGVIFVHNLPTPLQRPQFLMNTTVLKMANYVNIVLILQHTPPPRGIF